MAETVESIEGYGLNRDKGSKSGANIFSKIGIIGCGLLGQEITRLAVTSGLEVVFIEVTEEKIQLAIDELENSFDKMIDRWDMTKSEKRSIMGRIKGSTDYSILEGCDIVIESIKSRSRESNKEIRKEIFKRIEDVVDASCIIATNSTTLVITELASELDHPERCLSLHFVSPAYDSKVVETVRGLKTEDWAYEKVQSLAKVLSKRVIPVQESPGLISTRLIAPLINEACAILMEGIGTKEDIDATMKLGFGFDKGPFEMADKFGLDRVVRWLDNLYHEFGDTKYKSISYPKKNDKSSPIRSSYWSRLL